MTSQLSDAELVANIKAGGSKRQAAIAHLYKDKKLKNQILAFVTKNSGNRDDGIDVFHEGIISLDDNIRKNKYEGKGQLRGYLYSICRFIWLNKLKRSDRMVYTDETSKLDAVSYETPEALALSEEQKDILARLLEQLGEKCQQILEMWKLTYSMEEIAKAVGLKHAGMARKQRYVCYQKLMKVIEAKPHLKTILK